MLHAWSVISAFLPHLHYATAITFQNTVVGLVQNRIDVRQCGGAAWANVIAVDALPEF